MESIIKHYQVAHVGFSLSYPDSSQDMMAVLLEAYQAFECDEQVASAALTSFSLTLNESGEELRKPAGFKEECRQDEEGQLIISGSLGEKQKAFLMAMTDMKSILVTGHDYQHSSLLVPAGTFSQKSASGSLKATVDTSLMLLYAMRSHIVYIEQGNTLMSGTIRDNLLLANPVATDEQLTEALHVACADFVFSLPAGMDTKIGEHATRLSGGQAQRIAIARSLLREGNILLLDEISSSLDAETEKLLFDRLFASYADKTIICVTHRKEVADRCQEQIRL